MTESYVEDLRLTVDVGTQRVARVYAEALLNAAGKRGEADQALEELDSVIRDLYPADPHLEAFFSSGAIGRDRKAQTIRKLFEGRASQTFTNFLLVLNAHERLNLLRTIVVEAREIHEERTGRMRVLVQSAVPLPEDQQERLRQELRGTFKKEPLLDTRVDPELLGGLVVRVGDWLYDGSVRTQLDTIRNQLIARSSYEIQSRRDRFSSPNGD
jgi:F-type H+-transporting ATPase subunit delta